MAMAINVVRTQLSVIPRASEGSHLRVFVTQLGSVGYSVIARSLVVFATRDDTRFYSEANCRLAVKEFAFSFPT